MSMPYAGRQFTFHDAQGLPFDVRGWGNQSAAVFETLDGHVITQDPQSGAYHYASLSQDGQSVVASGLAVKAGQAPPESDAVDPTQATHAAVLLRRAVVATVASRDAHTETGLPAPAVPLVTASLVGGTRRWQQRRDNLREQLQVQSALHTLSAATGSDMQPAPPPAGTVGNYVGLCLLIQFPDVPGTIAQAEVERFCNQAGYTGFGNNGSVADYFDAVSDRKLRYTVRVAPYYTARQPRAYYTDRTIAYGLRAQELIGEALAALVASDFDFSALSSDSGGFVYALNALYAGDAVNNWAEGLWPHAASLATRFAAPGGKTFADYQITHIGAALTLRTFCHENGHMLCDFPDLYDTGYQSSGIGHYCLMCYGGSDTNPTQVSAYLKHAAGWTSKQTALTPGLEATVMAGSNDFLVCAKSATEYFIVENRQQSGRDAALPDAGLAIWHVDRLGSNNHEQMSASLHYECALEQADNRFDLERNEDKGDATDLYGGPAAATFGSRSAPASHWWNGQASGLEIGQISSPGPRMSLKVGFPGPSGQMKQIFGGGNGVVYVIASNGDLWWYQHLGASDGSFKWSAASPKKVGVGWGGLRSVFAAADGVIYGINDQGDLLWYRHDGRNDGSFKWADGSPKKVGAGWGGLRRVFAGGEGVIYGIQANGDLIWYRHDGRSDGSFRWAAGSPKKVGVGWGALPSVFCGDDGVIYAVNDLGDLLWFRHDGRADGSFRWAAGSPTKVGSGWDALRTVFSGGGGVIYGADDLGKLLWYRHDGRNDGSFRWAAGSPKTVGTGWLVAGRGVIYAVEPPRAGQDGSAGGGRLLWYRHDGRTDGAFTWAEGSPKQVGTGWGGMGALFAGGGGVIYGINSAGELLWYRHDGRDEGEFTWSVGSPRTVGVGWGGLRHVFCGDDGVIYTVNSAGQLQWFRHDGQSDGSFVWASAAPRTVGTGWGGMSQVFYGGSGVIYAINASGDLLWYRHDGRADGSFTWAARSGAKVGIGWGGLARVFSGGTGVIYVIDTGGNLLWFRHDGRRDGSFTWAAGSPRTVGVGWAGLAAVFAVG